MGKIASIFGGKTSTPSAPVTIAEGDTTEEDKAADRLRLAEKRRRGRRASILSNIGEEDIQSATFGRPAAAASNALRPPKNLFGS